MLKGILLGAMLLVGPTIYGQAVKEGDRFGDSINGTTHVIKDGRPVPMAKADDKKLPTEVAIPEVRQDKAKVLVLELALIKTQMEKLEAQYLELKKADEDKRAKIFAEFTSAAKAAGVEESQFEKYEFRLDALKMVLKKEEPKAEVKK